MFVVCIVDAFQMAIKLRKVFKGGDMLKQGRSKASHTRMMCVYINIIAIGHALKDRKPLTSLRTCITSSFKRMYLFVLKIL